MDENDKARAGALPGNPFEDTVPLGEDGNPNARVRKKRAPKRDDDKEESAKLAERVVALVKERATLFHDQQGTAYAVVDAPLKPIAWVVEGLALAPGACALEDLDVAVLGGRRGTPHPRGLV